VKAATTKVTQLLKQPRQDQNAVDELVPLLYTELRRLASHYLRRERVGHTLQATALVNEAYLRLADQRDVEWKNRGHFFGVAAQLMRRILVDHARRHQASKRGGPAQKLSLDEALAVSRGRESQLVELDAALTRLAALDPQQCRIVELRYFAGMTIEEIAPVLGISPRTVKREWAMAKAWLGRELEHGTAR
jgi:RNA polymerase sigma-70 factor, ECF subfamily